MILEQPRQERDPRIGRMSPPHRQPVAEYRELIELDAPTAIDATSSSPTDLQALLDLLGAEKAGSPAADLASLQAALAPLPAGALDPTIVARIERVLVGAREPGTEVVPGSLPTVADLGGEAGDHAARLALWVGDITDLAADAVVNAANSSLLGCRISYHFCIDYALHAGAGPRLRADCDLLVETQGAVEPVGSAKVTRGYCLPAPFVIHTVGPQLSPGSEPSTADTTALRSCYEACLETASEVSSIKTIAFCGISTGVFAYPKPDAARLAVETVTSWLDANPSRFQRVVFNLFSEGDADHYRRVFGLPPRTG